ncbi:intracellular septation protein [Candidatus Photodesmus blepharus]|uniref:Inner membrane-spanning protein YciB n=1 Tax=Candidatus Photodesmus blepharonis TaxID=1179155 RepID=A0A084CPA9_9GAMM|nr:intracellular septation protein [Candidatus Photodesmus blepharus]
MVRIPLHNSLLYVRVKQIIDFVPLLFFFILYKLYDVYIATGVLVIASTLQVIVTFVFYKEVKKMQLASFIILVVFGSMTIFLHDDNFIKWKVTITYTALSILLSASHLLGRPAIKGMLSKEITLPDDIWSKINWAWVCFFLFCAGLNIYISYEFSTDVWVNFKVFGLLIATFIFTLFTSIYIYKHMKKKEK